MQARRIQVKGVVQGVGFRPLVYRLARKYGLTGGVYNTSGDVTIEIEGPEERLLGFIGELRQAPPPQAHIESISETLADVRGYTGFEIRDSRVREDEYQLISPDLATCRDCRREILDPADRRFRYPFTNCTRCGPRFTVIEDIPYDRPLTTMRSFRMCPVCQREYDDPDDRRFHAQPNACPACGPHLELADAEGRRIESADVIHRAAELLRDGCILAVKGLGGFLLACDAAGEETVRELRRRKRRPAKPFAVMLKDMAEAAAYCRINDIEAAALQSPASPIVLLRRQGTLNLAPSVAPGLPYLGVMLPYTPLHHLLLNEVGRPLVMTSGNLSEEPIAAENREALNRLHGIADYYILHNRDISSRYDDSVVTAEQNDIRMVRRSRGYAPYPVRLPFPVRRVLACGPELKNTFCLTRDNYAFVSQHIGDLENAETLDHFEKTVRLYRKLFRIEPEVLACDLHPDYLSTAWAKAESARAGLPLVPVQHHYAHILSCLAENEVREPVIGVALDGTGCGADGRIWGSEFLLADYRGFTRKAHLAYLPLPGGNAAVRRPVRTAAGYLFSLLGEKSITPEIVTRLALDESEIEIIQRQVERSLNSPLTSSCGRLFDAVSALLGICREVEYEGQAAIELEVAAEGVQDLTAYPYGVAVRDGIRLVMVDSLFAALLAEIRAGQPVPVMAARFQNTVIEIVLRLCRDISAESGIRRVALSGGVFQNRRLLNGVAAGLKSDGLTPLLHRQVPCNDGCISLGQAVAAGQTVCE